MTNTVRTQLFQKFGVSENGKLAIYGAGVFGQELRLMLKVLGMKPEMFLDKNPLKWRSRPSTDDEIPCNGPETMLDAAANETLVIVAIKNNPDKIREDLLAMGFRHVVLLGDIEEKFHDEIEKKIDEIGIDLVSYMAKSGRGTDKCLEAGVFPMPVHFYQPVPDLADLQSRDIWSRVSKLDGLRWNTEKFLDYLSEVATFQPEEGWLVAPSQNSMEFCLENTGFSFVCASLLYGMILKNRPKRIIEIGSGNSSKVILQALSDIRSDANEGYDVEYTIIDPYCSFEEKHFAPLKVNILRIPVEEADMALFQALESDDILFVDSSHVVRIGGDVNFEILDVLPILAEGVFVHFHDIVMPYEYDKVYATNPKFRVFWTESYMLQAFLAFNKAYEILLPAAYLCKTQLETLESHYPNMMNHSNWGSGSFWIRRVYA